MTVIWRLWLLLHWLGTAPDWSVLQQQSVPFRGLTLTMPKQMQH